MINIPTVKPTDLLGGDVFNAKIGETGESLKTINSKAGKIKEEKQLELSTQYDAVLLR